MTVSLRVRIFHRGHEEAPAQARGSSVEGPFLASRNVQPITCGLVLGLSPRFDLESGKRSNLESRRKHRSGTVEDSHLVPQCPQIFVDAGAPRRPLKVSKTASGGSIPSSFEVSKLININS